MAAGDNSTAVIVGHESCTTSHFLIRGSMLLVMVVMQRATSVGMRL